MLQFSWPPSPFLLPANWDAKCLHHPFSIPLFFGSTAIAFSPVAFAKFLVRPISVPPLPSFPRKPLRPLEVSQAPRFASASIVFLLSYWTLTSLDMIRLLSVLLLPYCSSCHLAWSIFPDRRRILNVGGRRLGSRPVPAH